MTHLLLALALSSSVTEPTTLLDYGAPSGCPSASEFMDAVTGRGGDLSRPSSVAPARVLVVSIRKQEAGFGGTFHVRDQKGATGKRQVNGRSCAEVADALAVVTAIELQAEAAGGTGSATPPPAPPPPPSPTPAASPPPSAPDDRLHGTTQAFPKRTETVRVGAGDLRFDLSRGAALDAGATFGLIPSVWLPTYSLKMTTASFVTTPEGSQRITGPVIGLHINFLGRGTYESPDTRTIVQGATFGFSICQAPAYDTKGFVLLLCSEYGGGVLNLETKGLDGMTIGNKNAGFGTVTGAIDVQYNFTSRLFVTARLDGSMKLGDVTAERADGSRIFGSTAFATVFASATAGLGLRF